MSICCGRWVSEEPYLVGLTGQLIRHSYDSFEAEEFAIGGDINIPFRLSGHDNKVRKLSSRDALKSIFL